MKAFLNRVVCALYFYLCFAPVMMLLSQWILEDFTPGLMAAAVMLPVSLLIMLVPQSLGGKKASQAAAQHVSTRHMGSDPDPDRSLRSDALPVKTRQIRFPLRVVAAVLCALAIAAGVTFAPPDFLAEAMLGYRAVFAVGLAATLLMGVFSIATGEAVNLRSSVSGVVVYLVVGFFSSNAIRDPVMAKWLYFFGAGFLLVTGFLLNERALAAGAVSTQAYRPPKTILWRNRVILSVFALIVAGFACIDTLRRWASAAAAAFGRAIVAVIDWINRLLLPKDEYVMRAQRMEDSGLDIFRAEESASGWDISEIIAMAAAAIILVIILVLLIRKFSKFLVRFQKSLRAWMARFSQGVSEEYVDVREKLTDYDEENEGFAGELKKRLARLVKRDPKWESLSPRDRVRFLLTLIYRKNEKGMPGIKSMTAREALCQVNTRIGDLDAFEALYDRARYSQDEITQEEAERAKRDVKL